MRLACRTCNAFESAVSDPTSCARCGAALEPAPREPSPHEATSHEATSHEATSHEAAPRQGPVEAGGSSARDQLSESWFVSGNKGPAGPYGAAELAELFDRGELTWTDSVWRAGLRDWRPARRDEALVVAMAGVHGLDSATVRLDALQPLLASAPDRAPEALGGAARLDVSSLARGGTARLDRAQDAAAGAPAQDEDTQVDMLPAGLAKSWPLTTGPVGSRLTLRSNRPRWTARYLGLVVPALLAFVGGALIVSLTGRLARSAFAPAPVQAGPSFVSAGMLPAPVRGPAAVAPSRPSSGELVTRALPAIDEVRAELRRLGPAARRCARDPKLGVELDITIAGDSGRPRQIDVRTPRLTPGAIECTKAAVEDLSVAPFITRELVYRHRYAW